MKIKVVLVTRGTQLPQLIRAHNPRRNSWTHRWLRWSSTQHIHHIVLHVSEESILPILHEGLNCRHGPGRRRNSLVGCDRCLERCRGRNKRWGNWHLELRHSGSRNQTWLEWKAGGFHWTSRGNRTWQEKNRAKCRGGRTKGFSLPVLAKNRAKRQGVGQRIFHCPSWSHLRWKQSSREATELWKVVAEAPVLGGGGTRSHQGRLKAGTSEPHPGHDQGSREAGQEEFTGTLHQRRSPGKPTWALEGKKGPGKGWRQCDQDREWDHSGRLQNQRGCVWRQTSWMA